MEVQSQARAKPAGNQDQRTFSAAMHSVGKLKHAGFGEGQTSALAEFVDEVIDGTVRPIVQRMDQRIEQTDQWIKQTDQRIKQTDQLIKQTDQRIKQTDRRIEQTERQIDRADRRINRAERWMQQLESRMGQGFDMITGQIQTVTGQIRDLADSVRRLQSRPWMPYLIIGLAFSGLYIAVVGILLVLLSQPIG